MDRDVALLFGAAVVGYPTLFAVACWAHLGDHPFFGGNQEPLDIPPPPNYEILEPAPIPAPDTEIEIPNSDGLMIGSI